MIALIDKGGNILEDITPVPPEYISASVSASSGDAALVGRSSVKVVNGRGAFTDLAIDIAGWATIAFSSPGIAPLKVNISTFVGAPRALGLRSDAALAFGGIAFATQPRVAVLDRGGNLVASDAATRVAASLLDPSISLMDVAAGTPWETLADGASSARVVRIGGASYVVRASGGDATVMAWGCSVPEPLGSLGVAHATSISPFRFAGIDFLAVSANASTIVILQHVASPSDGVRGGGEALFAASVTAAAPGVVFTKSLLVGGRQFLAASLDGSAGEEGGTVLYELAASVNGSANLTVVQNVSEDASVLDIAHLSYLSRDFLLELTDSELRIYEWDHTLDTFVGGDVAPLANFSAILTISNATGLFLVAAGPADSIIFPLHPPSNFSTIALYTDGAVSLGKPATALAYLPRGATHLLALSSPGNLTVLLGDGAPYTSLLVLDADGGATINAAASPAVEFASEGGTDYLLRGGSVYKIAGSALLSGTTVVTASEGIAAFTDLTIDRQGSYRLAFSPVTLDAAHASTASWLAARAFSSRDLPVLASGAARLVQTSANVAGVAPEVKVVDAGGNDAATEEDWLVTAVLDDTDEFNILSDIQEVRPLPGPIRRTAPALHLPCTLCDACLLIPDSWRLAPHCSLLTPVS